ncbi:hypothetical protein [Nocardia sp. NPDC049149]|uniref:hypothetical protein n=1 Tax=Nocardia sp. NPDC049149 TaxID=3364315 RepID=UPI0037199292
MAATRTRDTHHFSHANAATVAHTLRRSVIGPCLSYVCKQKYYPIDAFYRWLSMVPASWPEKVTQISSGCPVISSVPCQSRGGVRHGHHRLHRLRASEPVVPQRQSRYGGMRLVVHQLGEE